MAVLSPTCLDCLLSGFLRFYFHGSTSFSTPLPSVPCSLISQWADLHARFDHSSYLYHIQSYLAAPHTYVHCHPRCSGGMHFNRMIRIELDGCGACLGGIPKKSCGLVVAQEMGLSYCHSVLLAFAPTPMTFAECSACCVAQQ